MQERKAQSVRVFTISHICTIDSIGDKVQLIWFILSAYGLTQILVYGSIFKSLRDYTLNYTKLLSCPMCTGFWVGTFLFFLNPFTELFTFKLNLANFLICGWLSSGTSYILCVLFDDNGLKITRN